MAVISAERDEMWMKKKKLKEKERESETEKARERERKNELICQEEMRRGIRQI